MLPIALRHALRSLRRTPVFSVTAIITLILGIGAATAMFVIVHGVLLAPLAFGNPDRLVAIALQTPELRRIQQPPGIYFTYARHARRIENLGFYRSGSANITDDGGPN